MDQSNNVHLRWNKHQTTLVSVFDSLLDNEKLTDCTVSAEGRHLRAHKIILSACSPYFEELFTENYEKYPIIILHNVKYNAVKALMNFMYRGEVDVPHEELSDVLKLSESLRVRGLSGSGYVNDVNKEKDSGRNISLVPPETLPSQPASVSCLTSGQNEPDDEVRSVLECSPTASPQKGDSVGVDTIPKSIQKYRKTINLSGPDKEKSQNVLEEVFTPDLDNLHQLPSQSQVLTTTFNSADGPLCSPISHQSVCRELQSASGEMAVTENKQFLMPEALLTGKGSANLSPQQQDISQQTKSEILESQMEIVEDLDDDDDNYSGDDDYRYDCNRVDGEFRRLNEGVKNEEFFHTQEINNIRSAFGSDYLNNIALTSSQAVLGKQFSCNSCGNSYRYQSGLWRHMKHQCGKEPQFQCSRCNYRCSRGDTLKRHMAARHCEMQKVCTF